MKELSISRTVICPREQEFESETHWGKNKFYKKNQPRSVGSCIKCEFHGGINEGRFSVACLNDERDKRAEIKSLEKALEIVKKHGGDSTQIEGVLDNLRGSKPKASQDE